MSSGSNGSPEALKAATYVRISTLNGQSVENQVQPIQDLIRARGWNLVGIYRDEGISGARERRLGLDRLIRDARARRFDIVVIAALDRLFRDTRHLLNLTAEWKSLGVQLVSLREALDFTTPVGQMTLEVLGAVASLERSLISERIKTALQVKKLAAQQSGSAWRCGRPLKIDAKTQEQILSKRGQGLSVRDIACSLGIAKSTVQRAIAVSQKPVEKSDFEGQEK